MSANTVSMWRHICDVFFHEVKMPEQSLASTKLADRSHKFDADTNQQFTLLISPIFTNVITKYEIVFKY